MSNQRDLQNLTSAKYRAGWLTAVPWQYFVMGEYPWNVERETAEQIYKIWIDAIETTMRTRLCFAVLFESQSVSGGRTPYHWHALLAALVPIPEQALKDKWRQLVKRQRSEDGGDNTIVVKPFDPSRGAAKYIMKFADDPAGHWDVGWLGLFHPELEHTPARRPLRHKRRWRDQKERHCGVLPESVTEAGSKADNQPTCCCAADVFVKNPGSRATAYAEAARIIKSSKRSEIVANKLAEYMWPADVISSFGIGTVESFDKYFETMTKQYGHSPEFLKKVDLDRRDIFNARNLIYTIRDEHGSPIAFSARNLAYTTELAAYRAKVEKIEADKLSEEQRKEAIGKLFKPRKYVNNSETPLFSKGKVLFNFHQAKKSTTKALIVFEGNADCVTLFAGGVKTAVATCGTAFTEDHLQLALDNGVTKIILVNDADAAGEKGTELFVKRLEQFSGHVGLEVEIIAMPAGTDDPDAYVRAFGDLKKGVAEFRKLPRTDLFTWKLRKSIEEGADPYVIAEENLPLLVNIPGNIARLKKADNLAEATGLPKEVIHRELLRLLDSNEMEAEEERAAIAQQTVKALQQNPKAMDAILATAATRLEAVNGTKLGYDAQVSVRVFQGSIDKMESATDMFELVTGNPIFDELMGGIPREAASITIPGKPHHGKSIFIDNLVVGLLENNPNLQIFLHHVDDANMLRLPRLLGVVSDPPPKKWTG